MHGSGTRAKLSRQTNRTAEASRLGARKAAALAKSKAAAVLEKAHAAREKTREGRAAREARQVRPCIAF